ncbi:YdcF family protein [Parvularcula lutaonensis]|uniref:YdcF family protein n=1 Tax=Parvularcula lutaonensis TaxID=491923 RepID=A0ABV7M8X4_9PROT|nr:YdcF family protein [Parvularcula lutaonensis]GGY45087.1 membrane protein [Parvularcula lutaonensis]
MRLPRLARRALAAGFISLLLLVAGFFVFAATLPRADEAPLAGLDPARASERGIVVLTGGGGHRIEEGLALHARGLGDRVLISGVNPRTTKSDLAPMGDPERLACCVDLGPYARTTRGNAIESRDWLRQNGYTTALLVTSDFHLPRATIELRRSAPEISVIGVPVASVSAPEQGWMSKISAWRLLVGEYLKYLVVRMRSII